MSESTEDRDAPVIVKRAPAARAPVGMPATTRIVVEENEDIPPTGLPIGVNGKAYILKAGEEVDVPQGVLDVLRNAIVSVPQFDPTSRRVISYRPRMRFPFRVVSKDE